MATLFSGDPSGGELRRIYVLISLAGIGALAFGQYLQHALGVIPCPMCIVQRYAVALVALIAGLTAVSGKRSVHIGGSALMVLAAGFGAFVAARQTWLQWYPPEYSSCGRDFYGMIEAFPLQRVIPMMFKGSGDCSKIDWTFLGGSLANWGFLFFSAITLLGLAMIWRTVKRR